MRVWVLLGFLLASSVWAGNIQYRLDTGDVTGASDLKLSVPEGTAVIVIDGATADIVWPVPVGCTVGQAEWSRVINADIVAVDGTGLEARTDLALFHTTSTLLPGCHLVQNWRELKRLFERTMIEAIEEDGVTTAINQLNVPKQELCPATNNSQNCLDWRATMDAINVRYPSRVQFKDLAADIRTLIDDSFAFRTSQCSAHPGGPFC